MARYEAKSAQKRRKSWWSFNWFESSSAWSQRKSNHVPRPRRQVPTVRNDAVDRVLNEMCGACFVQLSPLVLNMSDAYFETV